MLQDRINYFKCLFKLLINTNSRNEKEQVVKIIKPEFKEDFDFIIECLAGKHKFGYTYKIVPHTYDEKFLKYTIKEVLTFLLIPASSKNLTEQNIINHIKYTTLWADFFEPIVNRTLRLGIGNSLIKKTITSPMLGKKFDGGIKTSKKGYYITEKLDGNRCIAWHDGINWNFTSRNGKEMYVDFDMSSLNKDYVYDGEVLSPAQVGMSINLTNALTSKNHTKDASIFNTDSDYFNSTSGLINRHTKNKELIYNIFDIIDNDSSYDDRRKTLDALDTLDNKMLSENVRILPVLDYHSDIQSLYNSIFTTLDDVTSMGAEGLMINLADGKYINKRTDQLLKLKKVYTIDMQVIDVEYGKGKYEYGIGNLICRAFIDNKLIECSVGTGLSDEQRFDWAAHPENIVGKIVEVSYFSISQNKNNKDTNVYSLRFPRLKQVRYDKNDSSIY